MEGIILEFAACCRADGLGVATSDVLDCLDGLRRVAPWDEALFHTILRANFAKSIRERSEFERLYRLFFREMKRGRIPGERACPDAAAPGPDDLQDLTDLDRAMGEMIRQEGLDGPAASDLDRALAEFMAGDPKRFIEAVRKVHDQEVRASSGAVKSNLGQLTLRLSIMLAAGRMRQRAAIFLGGPDAVVRESPGDTGARRLAAQAEARLDRALEFLNADPAPDNPGLRQSGAENTDFAGLGNVPFSNLTRDEMDRVTDVIDLWVKKLKDISTLRFSAARRGRVDVMKTIRRSGRYLGVPVEIIRKDRPLRKGKIVTLCDVSGSVWSTARFMLSILYALQDCFARVRSYVFIDGPMEVTPFFVDHDANTAVRKILSDPGLNYNAKTDYGLVFQEFRDRHLGILDKKTTLIVMGDARSNYFNPREPVLSMLRERCRRLAWLNPEQERFWGTGDSEMLRYRRYCNEARPCGNLNQLIDFIQELVL